MRKIARILDDCVYLIFIFLLLGLVLVAGIATGFKYEDQIIRGGVTSFSPAEYQVARTKGKGEVGFLVGAYFGGPIGALAGAVVFGSDPIYGKRCAVAVRVDGQSVTLPAPLGVCEKLRAGQPVFLRKRVWYSTYFGCETILNRPDRRVEYYWNSENQ